MLTEITGVDLKAEIYYDEVTFKATLMMDEMHLGSLPLREYERLVKNQYYGFHPENNYENLSKLSIMLFDTPKVKGGFVCNMSENEDDFEVEFSIPFGIKSILWRN